MLSPTATLGKAAAWRGRPWPRPWAGKRFGGLEVAFLLLLAAALGMRLWELGARTMHYDEAIHLHYAWRLANGEGFIHSPWMHGPFQVEFTALVLRLFGDTDFTARLGYVFFGTALVGLPYFFRRYIGNKGAFFTGVMLALSPALLYFSRFGRNDIIMAFWAAALLMLIWRYIHEGKDRYLYLASAILALAFATKETVYFIVLIFGGILFLLALPDLVPWALGRHRLRNFQGPAGLLVLLVTLTLPQWSAASGLVQDLMGLTLVTPDGVTGSLVGAPQWAGPFVPLPVFNAPWWFTLLAAAHLLGVLSWLAWRRSPTIQSLLVGVGVPVLGMAAVYLAVFRPVGYGLTTGQDPSIVDFPLAGIALAFAVALLVFSRHPWKRGALLVAVPALLALIYSVFFTSVVKVGPLVNGLLPDGVAVDTSVNGLPVNYMVALGILAASFLVSLYLGMRWRGGVWLACAAVFYMVWTALYTTLFTNWAGIFSGVWQGMGYWIAQQEVARGNQPWYYYFVGVSVYEFLPVIFGVLGAIYYFKKGEVLGIVLAVWAGLTFLAYTVASEKMPWLLVNISLPFILLSGMYLGELADRVPWKQMVRRGLIIELTVPALALALGGYLVYRLVNLESAIPGSYWAILLAAVGLALVAAYLVRVSQPRRGLALASLGTAALLLAFGTWGAVRAAYTYDDSTKELLVYAQGSVDLQRTFQQLEGEVFNGPTPQQAVKVDYDLWYPLQWYVRHLQRENALGFSCYKAQGEEGWTQGCAPVTGTPEAEALLLTTPHSQGEALDSFRKEGPRRNLLWFPESYRRPGENRHEEGMAQEVAKDFRFFQDAVTSRATWRVALDYIFLRRLDREWYQSEFFTYMTVNRPSGR